VRVINKKKKKKWPAVACKEEEEVARSGLRDVVKA
jgi:hypothetical protein